jgi:hypothetical protein
MSHSNTHTQKAMSNEEEKRQIKQEAYVVSLKRKKKGLRLRVWEVVLGESRRNQSEKKKKNFPIYIREGVCLLML